MITFDKDNYSYYLSENFYDDLIEETFIMIAKNDPEETQMLVLREDANHLEISLSADKPYVVIGKNCLVYDDLSNITRETFTSKCSDEKIVVQNIVVQSDVDKKHYLRAEIDNGDICFSSNKTEQGFMINNTVFSGELSNSDRRGSNFRKRLQKAIKDIRKKILTTYQMMQSEENNAENEQSR